MGSNKQSVCDASPVPYHDIDRSCRWPVLLLLTKGTFWLVLSLVLGLVSSIKMHAPDFLSSCGWVSYGRIRPAFFSAFIYGFAIQASLGLSLWMLARLGRTRLVAGGLALLGGVIWNAGLLLGVLQIMGGQSTGFTWMEMPREAASLLCGGFFLIALSAFSTLRYREEKELYISHWFMIAALLCFLWVMSLGYYLGVLSPVRGAMQAVVGAWFVSGMQYLVLIPFGLAVAYYLLPKLSGKPVYSGQAAALGFWMLILFGGWTALSMIPQGPFPRWMLATGASCKFMLLMVVACFAANWFMTLHLGKKVSTSEPSWSFLVCAAWALMAGLVLDVFGATKSLLSSVAFTTYAVGVTHVLFFGFLTLVLMAGVYYVSERVLDGEWASRGLIRVHLGLSLLGLLFVSAGYIFGGLFTGTALNQSSGAFVDAARAMIPFMGAASAGYLLLLLGQLVLALNLVRTLIATTAEERAGLCAWCCGDIGSSKKVRAGV
ncbi:MAG: cbb3-type cytochrome c oxidase subunit I [Verrucomicrobiales bacterium]|nr:cbb3-type cytochrome c oxidase subunit I [Verrucomicrobiales bacterium]